MDNRDDFKNYPFSKRLDYDVKLGHYKVIFDSGENDVVEASSAKEAISKCEGKKIAQLTYLGFVNKVIFKSADLIVKEYSEENLDNDYDSSSEKDNDNSGIDVQRFFSNQDNAQTEQGDVDKEVSNQEQVEKADDQIIKEEQEINVTVQEGASDGENNIEKENVGGDGEPK